MSTKKEKLIAILAEYFYKYKSYELNGVLKEYGIDPDDTLKPEDSKKMYIRSGLVKMNVEEIAKLSKQIAQEIEDVSYNKQIGDVLGDTIFEITHITRRKLAECLSEDPNLPGKIKLNELLYGIWDMNETFVGDEDLFLFPRVTLEEYIVKHVIENNDLSYMDLLLDVLKIKYISDNMLTKFLERLVNPEVRNGEEQAKYVKRINDIIGADGFELVASGKKSNELIYKVCKRGIKNSNLKNLIFAPLGIKPDIVIDDAIANEIKILGDMDNCLLYNFEPNADGLLWSTLVKWWGITHTSDNIQKDLFMRLYNSLDSAPEKAFFSQYYEIHKKLEDYPALIPQVYLHYDPHAKTWRGNNMVYTHQRMDFLMLLPDGIRVVIEIDGKQHYSEGDKSSPKLYAEMMVDNRELQLKGYEVYRFGGHEFINSQKMKETVREFFEMLFKKYPI